MIRNRERGVVEEDVVKYPPGGVDGSSKNKNRLGVDGGYQGKEGRKGNQVQYVEFAPNEEKFVCVERTRGRSVTARDWLVGWVRKY